MYRNHIFKKKKSLMKSSFMMQQIKNPVLSLYQLGPLLWHGFSPCPGNFHMLRVWPKKKKKKKGKEKPGEIQQIIGTHNSCGYLFVARCLYKCSLVPFSCRNQ